jgi:hypothetical protein
METAVRCGAAVVRTHLAAWSRDPDVLPWLGTGGPLRTAGKDVAASSVTPAFGKPAETKKALYVVALSRSALRSFLESPANPTSWSLGVVGATTGTCEFGQGVDMPIATSMQGKISIFALAD